MNTHNPIMAALLAEENVDPKFRATLSDEVDYGSCYACDRKLSKLHEPELVDTRDGQLVYVGPECFRKIKAAGDTGYQPPKGGPRLWLIKWPEIRP